MTGFSLSLNRMIFIGQFLKFAQTAAGQAVQVQHQCFDAVVLRRGTYRVDVILEQGFAKAHALRRREPALQRPAGQLLYQVALGRDHQRSLRRNARLLAGDTRQQDDDDEEQKSQMQKLSCTVRCAPNANKQ